MGRLFVRPFLALVLLVSFAGGLSAQATNGVIRGTVLAEDGAPIATAEVTAANVETGVRITTLTGTSGAYVFPAIPIGLYNIEARRIGYRAQVRENVRVSLGQTVVVAFDLSVGAAELEPIVAEVEQGLIDPDEAGVVDLVSAEQVEAIPVAGRNFSDLVALSPKVGVDIGDGTGGALSLGGGRRGANLIQIDGAGSTGTFFGGEARGSDRIPFAYSIEAVREFQVVSNGFDVEYGFFSGGVINAVTKSGTNEFHGSAFTYLRNDTFTKSDFFGRSPDFTSRQIGLTLSGPIIRDQLHFYMAVERQDRDEPVFGLPDPSDAPDSDLNFHPDSVARFLDILDRVYGVEDFAGVVDQTQDETTIFGRIDWQINNDHRMTLRHNYTDLSQEGDRISSNETFLNGGVFNNTGNSTVASLTSTLSPNLWNEFRVQYATEPRPREANSLLPEGEVFISSDFADGVQRRGDMECCNDPVLPNNLEETTWEIVNNLNYTMGDHEFKFGAHFNNFSYVNFFFFNQQGQFEFDNLDDFENRVSSKFTRNLPNPGPDNLFFTDDDILPLAEYDARELGLYAQDTYRASDRLSVTAGLRFDITSIPDEAPLNDDLLSSSLGLRTDVTPDDSNISPRLSFTFDPNADGSSIIRGGVGLFFGRFPSVLYSNSLLNTGGNQVSLRCDDEEVPTPDYQAYANDLAQIPTSCVGGGAASPPIPNINVFAEDFEYPRTWKASLGYERDLGNGLRLSLDGLYSNTSQNFAIEDVNLLPQQFQNAEGRPVFAPIDEIDPDDGESGFGDNRREAFVFNEVLVHKSDAEARTYQLSAGLEQRMTDWLSWQFGYTYTDSKDNASYSCCISNTFIFETPTAGSPNFLGDPGDELVGTWGPSDFARKHTFVLSGIAKLPYNFQVSGIWRAFSGRPFTPVVDGDVNSDGSDANDRVYVIDTSDPTDVALLADPTEVGLLEDFYSQWSCLRENVGMIITRNACGNDMFTQLDVRVKWRYDIGTSGTALELIADVFNVLNLINDDWSRNVGVSQFGSGRELLDLEGFDPATGRHLYSVNPSFGRESDLTAQRTDQGSAQLGVRFIF